MYLHKRMRVVFKTSCNTNAAINIFTQIELYLRGTVWVTLL